jgi:hypothetical protein
VAKYLKRCCRQNGDYSLMLKSESAEIASLPLVSMRESWVHILVLTDNMLMHTPEIEIWAEKPPVAWMSYFCGQWFALDLEIWYLTTEQGKSAQDFLRANAVIGPVGVHWIEDFQCVTINDVDIGCASFFLERACSDYLLAEMICFGQWSTLGSGRKWLIANIFFRKRM